MKGWTSRAGERGRWIAQRVSRGRAGLALGIAMLAICVGFDIALQDESAAIVGTYVVAPLVTAFIAPPAAVAIVGVLAVGAAAASPEWNMATRDSEQLVRIGVIAFGTGVGVLGAWLRTHTAGRSERLRLLDAVGAVADGSLPLAETLRRVTDVVVPVIGDICMVDAVHEGRARRIAVRAQGRADAEEIEERIRMRKPDLPPWLVHVERPWREIPRWMPRMTDEELRRMAHSRADLEFLRSLGIRSTIVAPIRARDRNLGTLTLVTAWSGRRYSAEDLRFARILASRIGLALDNAGLFSDLESIERRMDTVMSILDEAVVIHGADGELIFANPAAARTLGYETSEQALGMSTAEIRDRFEIRDEAGRTVPAEALVGRRALSGEIEGAQVLRVVDKQTGREGWTRTKARPIEGPTGDVLYSVTAIEDVSGVKRAEFTNWLLARTGELLSHSADYLRTLEGVPPLVVPEFADWCAVELPRDEGGFERVAMQHREPETLAIARALRERYPDRIYAGMRVTEVIAAGEARAIEITEAWLRAAAADEEHLKILRELDIGSLIIAPMTVGGERVGALTFVNHRGSRVFDGDDVTLAAELARRAGFALANARIAEERARVADALQRELLPPTLPRMHGWEVATMYEPAGEINDVGGDFYEVFQVPGGWAVVLGDVSGRGAAAAALTAEARHTIRTAGSFAADPCAGLHLLDENLRGRDDAALCSIAMLVLPEMDEDEVEVLVYLAGHPHPLLLRDSEAEPVGTPGPLLGVSESPAWKPALIRVRQGDQLVLYTDGVIEAKRHGGERFGSDRLRVGLLGSRSPEHTVDRVRAELQEFGAQARDDDAAVVAVRRRRAAIQLPHPSDRGALDVARLR
jgi:PAS domain S-box-containing protein